MFRSCYAQKDNLQQIFEYKMKNKNAKRNLNTANTPSTANNNPSHIFRKALKLCKIVKKHPRYVSRKVNKKPEHSRYWQKRPIFLIHKTRETKFVSRNKFLEQ